METGQMQEEQHNSRSPFDNALFFPDSSQSSILETIKKAIIDSTSLITCVSYEGQGKTTLCKSLENEFSEPYLVISFPYSVESFDYVLQIIALKLNLNSSTEDNPLGTAQLLTEISRTMRAQGKQLLILFDEAEKLYLATLERVRKMMDFVNEDTVLLQIILFGRMGLQQHIEQLALCTFKKTKELHLTLPSLTEEEIFEYLNFCMRQYSGASEKDTFSREVAAKILSLSQGNFRKINSLAGHSLRSLPDHADNTSFMVLLEHVRDSDDLPVEAPPVYKLPLFFTKKRMAIGAGVLCTVALLLLFINKEEKKPSIPVATQHQSKKPAMPVVTQQPSKKPAMPVVTQQPSKPAQPITADQSFQPVPAAVAQPLSEQSPPPQVVRKAPVAIEPPVAAPPASAPVIIEAPPIAPVPDTVAINEAIAESAPSTTPAIIKAPIVEPVQPKPVTAEKHLSERKILIADKIPKKTGIPLVNPEPFKKNKDLLNLKKGSTSALSQQLPKKSLAAGARWLTGKNNDLFTLQLMVLSADQAEEKLSGIVKNKEGSEQYIILRKMTSPTTLLLFYGEYATLAAARIARNELPASLQQYTPYPLSIKQAVAKAK